MKIEESKCKAGGKGSTRGAVKIDENKMIMGGKEEDESTRGGVKIEECE